MAVPARPARRVSLPLPAARALPGPAARAARGPAPAQQPPPQRRALGGSLGFAKPKREVICSETRLKGEQSCSFHNKVCLGKRNPAAHVELLEAFAFATRFSIQWRLPQYYSIPGGVLGGYV